MKTLKINNAQAISKNQQKSINGGLGGVDNTQPNPCGSSPGIFFSAIRSECDRIGGIFYNNRCYLCN